MATASPLDQLIVDLPEWMRDGLCVEYRDTVEFFPGRGESAEPAKAVCARCLVRQECLRWALEAGIKYGVFGGLTERQRRQVRRAHVRDRRDGSDVDVLVIGRGMYPVPW